MTEPTADIQSDQPQEPRSWGGSGTAVVGGILILLGIVFLVGQQLEIDLAEYGWPFYVIAPGVALLAFGLAQRGGVGLAIAGSIVTIVGLVLLYQNSTNHWESWAYAWALVGPGGAGVGQLLHGTRTGNAKVARDGFWQVLIALGLFAAGFVFFEGIIGVSGDRFALPEWVLPAVVIALGVAVLLRGVFGGRRDWDDHEPAES